MSEERMHGEVVGMGSADSEIARLQKENDELRAAMQRGAESIRTAADLKQIALREVQRATIDVQNATSKLRAAHVLCFTAAMAIKRMDSRYEYEMLVRRLEHPESEV